MKVFLLIISLACVACSSTPSTQYYSLLAPNVDTFEVTEKLPAIGIGPIKLPERLDNIGIVSIQSGNQLQVGLFDVWAGDLEENITSVMADHLSQRLNHNAIWPFPWDNRHRPEWQLRIIFERFSGSLGESVTLQAKWTLLGDNGRKELITKKFITQKQTASASYNDYVSALNEALNELSDTIAKALQTI